MEDQKRNDVSNTATNALLIAVEKSKKEYNAAESVFLSAKRSIEQKARTSMDLFGDDTISKVGDLVSETKNASDELYASLQALVVTLDAECRIYIDQEPDVTAVYEVVKMIKQLNEASKIENDYNASLNSTNLGTMAAVRYSPSMACLVIEKFWEQHFRSLDGSNSIIKEEKERKREEEKREREAKKKVREAFNEDHDVSVLRTMQSFDVLSQNNEDLKRLIKTQKDINYACKKEKSRLEELTKRYNETMTPIKQEIGVLENELNKLFVGAKRKKRVKSRLDELKNIKSEEEKRFRQNQVDIESYIAFLNDKLEEIEHSIKLFTPKRGDEVILGCDPTSKKPMEWIVVGCSSESIALLSKSIIGIAQFKKTTYSYQRNELDYIEWLKGFEKKAFSASEKKLLMPYPIEHNDAPQYAFVYTQRDVKDYLGDFLPAKATKAIISQIESTIPSDHIYSYKYCTNSFYWLHSRETFRDERINCVRQDDDGNWKIQLIENASEDMKRGVRPGIIIKRTIVDKIQDVLWDNDTYSKEKSKYFDAIIAEYSKTDAAMKIDEEKYDRLAVKKSKRKKTLVATGIIAAVALVIYLLSTFLFIPIINYNKAEEYLKQGKNAEAAIMFGKAGSFSDAKVRSFALWADVTNRDVWAAGGSSTERKMLLAGISEDGTPLIYDEKNKIEVEDGKYVAVASSAMYVYFLKPDGTVEGQSNWVRDVRSKWKNIVNIKAGTSGLIFGLKSDGTVVSADVESQQYVDDWINIIDIAVGKNHVVGLKFDGTVVASTFEGKNNNYNGELNVNNWTDIQKIEAGMYCTVGLKTDGTVVVAGNFNYDEINEISKWTDIVDISVRGGFVAGLKSDGTVVVSGDLDGKKLVHDWSDIVMVECGCYCLLGIKSDGTILTSGNTFYYPKSWPELKDLP